MSSSLDLKYVFISQTMETLCKTVRGPSYVVLSRSEGPRGIGRGVSAMVVNNIERQTGAGKTRGPHLHRVYSADVPAERDIVDQLANRIPPL